MDYRAKHGYSPTYRDLAERIGVTSPNAIVENLRPLVKKGALSKASGQARSLVPRVRFIAMKGAGGNE